MVELNVKLERISASVDAREFDTAIKQTKNLLKFIKELKQISLKHRRIK